MQFRLPSPPAQWNLHYLRLTVRVAAHLDEEWLRAHGADWRDGNERIQRSAWRIAVKEFAEQEGRLSTYIELEETEEPPAADVSCYITWHWPAEATDDATHWDEDLAALGRELGSTAVSVSGTWVVPTESVILGVDLPVNTAIEELPEIRGVRLARRDPADEEQDLYTVLLNEHGSDVVVTVSLEMETELNESTLVNAWEQVLAISQFAVTLGVVDEE